MLLTELDGLEELEDVVVIAATNRPALIDNALTRAGWIGRKIEVGAPDEATRREILTIHTRKRPLADDVDLDQLAADMDGLVGADVAALCRGAATAAVREHVRSQSDDEPTAVEDTVLTQAHFETVLEEITTGDPQFPQQPSARGAFRGRSKRLIIRRSALSRVGGDFLDSSAR